MKKTFILIAACCLTGVAMAQSDEVTIKRGKAVMSESYYYQMRQEMEEMSKELKSLQNELKTAKATEAKLTEQVKRLDHGHKQITTFNDSASYAIARDIAASWQQQHLGIDLDIVSQSFYDMAHGNAGFPPQVSQSLLQRFQQNFEENQRKKHEEMMASLEKNKAAGKKFLKENANNKSVYTTNSGLQYRIVKKGEGRKPTAKNMVRVHYTGTFIDGKKFDSSYDRGNPAEFYVNQVIPGWTEGLQLMNVGSKYIFYVPSELGYGDRINGEIPPGSTLIFEVELLDIVK